MMTAITTTTTMLSMTVAMAGMMVVCFVCDVFVGLHHIPVSRSSTAFAIPRSPPSSTPSTSPSISERHPAADSHAVAGSPRESTTHSLFPLLLLYLPRTCGVLGQSVRARDSVRMCVVSSKRTNANKKDKQGTETTLSGTNERWLT